MASVIVDTDVASRLLRGDSTGALAAVLVGTTIEITFVTVDELLAWAEARAWGGRRRRELETWLDETPVLPYSRSVAESWARLTARARQRGRPRPATDTWAAACCLAYELPLATLNRKDFFDFERHDGLALLPVI